MKIFHSLKKELSSYMLKINRNIPVKNYADKQVQIQHETHLVLKEMNNTRKLYESEWYHCVHCSITLHQMKLLIQHKCTRDSNDETSKLVCTYCNLEYTNTHNLEAHETTCSKLKPLTICSKRLKPDKYQSHILWCKSRMTSESKKLKNCSYCEETFPDDTTYSNHREECHGKFSCPHCYDKIRGMNKFKLHVEQCCKKYTCTICNRNCKNSEELDKHVSIEHN